MQEDAHGSLQWQQIYISERELEMRTLMQDDGLSPNLRKRIEDLWGRERSYWEDELYSLEALTDLHYRAELERCFNLDPLGPLPPRP